MSSVLTTGEAAIFDALVTALSATENTNAFRDEFPETFADASVDYMWTAYFQGGGLPDDIWQIPGGSWCINGTYVFEGIYKTRDQAWSHACTLKSTFPKRTITNVRLLRFARDPELTRVVVRRSPDQTTSGELRVWKLRIEFDAEMRYA